MLLLAASLLASDSSAMRCSRFFILESIALMVWMKREKPKHGGNPIPTNRLKCKIYSLLIDSQILLRIMVHTYFRSTFLFIGNRILYCSEILLESIKVLLESFTVNVRWLPLKASYCLNSTTLTRLGLEPRLYSATWSILQFNPTVHSNTFEAL